MEFTIKQGATMPYLNMELIQDGINDHLEFFDKIQNADVRFSMQEVNSCIKRVVCRPMLVVEDECGKKCSGGCYEQYYLVYKWRERDTKKKGRYEGTIEIDFLDDCGKLIVPIREKLYINVI